MDDDSKEGKNQKKRGGNSEDSYLRMRRSTVEAIGLSVKP